MEEKAEQKSQARIKQLELENEKQIQRINEKNELEREKEVRIRVANALSEEKAWIELKHKEELAIKDKQIEAAKFQNVTLVDEKIRQAVIDNEVTHRQREKEFELQHNRIEADNKKLMDQVEKLQKTLDNIPPELRGTAGEFVLIDELKNEFRTDEILPKKPGVPMADVVQIIVTEAGERISTPIVYDKKMGDSVTKSDLVKAKNYKIVHKTDYSIIVTSDIKSNNRHKYFTEERQGILLVHPLAVVDMAKRIRSFLIETSRQTRNNAGRDSKQAKLYDYFTSPEYSRDLRIKLEAKSNLDEIQRNEEEYHRKVWNKRKEFIDKWFELDRKNERIISDITTTESEICRKKEVEQIHPLSFRLD